MRLKAALEIYSVFPRIKNCSSGDTRTFFFVRLQSAVWDVSMCLLAAGGLLYIKYYK